MKISPLAGHPPPQAMLLDVAKLVTAYYAEIPDPSVPAQRVGFDTHALSVPACTTAVEVLAANGTNIMLAEHDAYTPTPAVSHAILSYNRGRSTGLADGIVVTPSHNPPDNGGFKYNPPTGGPADSGV